MLLIYGFPALDLLGRTPTLWSWVCDGVSFQRAPRTDGSDYREVEDGRLDRPIFDHFIYHRCYFTNYVGKTVFAPHWTCIGTRVLIKYREEYNILGMAGVS